MAISHDSGAPAPLRPAPAGFLPITFPSEGTGASIDGGLDRLPVLFVDSTAPAECLLAAAKLRLDLINNLTTIATCWHSPFGDDLHGFGELLEPLIAEASSLVTAALGKGGAA